MKNEPEMEPNLQNENILPILRIKSSDVQPRVLVVGDPERAAKIASLCEDSKQIGRNREYLTYNARWKNTPITIVSHGVGACGAAVAFEELCRAGARYIVRSGTAGGLQNHINDGDLVVATAAVRADGLSQRIVPLEYPAVGDLSLTHGLNKNAKKYTQNIHTGVVATQASFYPSPIFDNEQLTWQKIGAIAVEMEIAALFIIGAYHQVKCGAVVAIDGNPLKAKDETMENYNPHRQIVNQAIENALYTALDTLTEIYEYE